MATQIEEEKSIVSLLGFGVFIGQLQQKTQTMDHTCNHTHKPESRPGI
jgi:hypothetical protein